MLGDDLVAFCQCMSPFDGNRWECSPFGIVLGAEDSYNLPGIYLEVAHRSCLEELVEWHLQVCAIRLSNADL